MRQPKIAALTDFDAPRDIVASDSLAPVGYADAMAARARHELREHSGAVENDVFQRAVRTGVVM